MSVDFAAAGLLDGIEDEAARADRLRLLGELHEAGVSIAELRRAVHDDRLALLPVERVLAGGGEHVSLREAAERTGQELDTVVRVRRALGLSTPDPDEPIVSAEELRAIGAARTFAELGIGSEDRLEVARVIGRAMADVASALREVVARATVTPEATERELALRYAAIAREAGPLVGPVLEAALTAHLREQLSQDVLRRVGLEGATPGTTRVAVAFADMVGFTRLGEERPVEELGAVAQRMEELATEVAGGPVRLVKLIGDAAMLSSSGADQLLEAGLSLIDASEAAGPDFPMLRVGGAMGEAVLRAGDVYGHTVNLASRLSEIARPGTMLVDEGLVDAAGPGFTFSFAGKRKLKNIRAEVPVFRARRAQPREVG